MTTNKHRHIAAAHKQPRSGNVNLESARSADKPQPVNADAGPEAQPLDRNSALLLKIQHLLENGHVQAAFDAAKGASGVNQRLKNAYGVCLLRLGDSTRAITVFRDLALMSGGVCLRTDAPLTFKTNFATALLMANNVSGCLTILHELRDEKDETIENLWSAIRKWEAGMSTTQGILWRFFQTAPNRPIVLDFVPGDMI